MGWLSLSKELVIVYSSVDYDPLQILHLCPELSSTAKDSRILDKSESPQKRARYVAEVSTHAIIAQIGSGRSSFSPDGQKLFKDLHYTVISWKL